MCRKPLCSLGYAVCAMVGLSVLCTSVTSGSPILVSQYLLNESLDNSVVGEPHGGAGGTGPLAYVPGVIGQAVQFDGTNYIDLTTDGRPNAAGGLRAGSVGFWISTTASDRMTMGSANTGANTLFRLQLNTYNDSYSQDGLCLYVRAEGGSERHFQFSTSNPTWRDGDWHHILFAWDAAADPFDRSIYIDGVPQTVAADYNQILPGHAFSDWGFAPLLGAWNNRGTWEDHFRSGTAMDDVGIWDAPLGDQRVAAIAGLGWFSSIDQGSPVIDSILALGPGEAVAAGDDMWHYTTTFVDALDGNPLVAGRNYVGVDGFNYIILGTEGAGFVGVTTVPEPGTSLLVLFALVCGVLVRRRARPAGPTTVGKDA